MSAIADELDQLHEYTRTNLQLLIQWWIFFATANYVVLGIFAAKMLEGSLHSRWPLYLSSVVFFGVNLESVWFCFQARRWFRQAGEAVSKLRAGSEASQPLVAILPKNSFPHGEYSRLMGLIIVTIILMGLSWAAFALVARWLQI